MVKMILIFGDKSVFGDYILLNWIENLFQLFDEIATNTKVFHGLF